MDRGSAFVAGVVAGRAPGALVKVFPGDVVRREPEFGELLLGRFHLRSAIFADSANETLRQNRSQRRGDKEFGNPHILQTGDRARRVVRVERAEDQVAGQRRLDGDLRGLAVADFPDEDFVRVLPQNRTQALRERVADFRVDRHLDDAVDVVFDRVFGRHQFFGDNVQLRKRGVQGRRFPGTGRAGNEDNAVRRLDDLPELRHQLLRHPDVVQVERNDRLVQNSANDAFAEHRRQDADAEIDRRPGDHQANTTVLREAFFGDVEVRQNLNTGRDRAGQVARRRNHFVQRSVRFNADFELVFERFEVDVAGVVFDPEEEDHIQELAHRRAFGKGFGASQVEFAVFVERVLVFLIVFEVVEDRLDAVALVGGVVAFEGRVDFLRRRNDDANLVAEEVAQLVHYGEVLRLARGDRQRVVAERQRNGAVHMRHRFGEVAQHFLRNGQVGNRDDLQSELFAERLRELILGQHIHTNRDLADQLAGALALLFAQKLQLFFVNIAEVDEDLPKTARHLFLLRFDFFVCGRVPKSRRALQSAAAKRVVCIVLKQFGGVLREFSARFARTVS